MAKKGEDGGAPAPAPVPEKSVPTKAVPEAAVEELPRTIVRRVVKDKLSQLSSGGEGEADVIVNKDALLAFAESARIFIHYLSATANDICKESKRQTINAEDVLGAIEEIEFPEFIEPLRTSLEEFRRKHAIKKSGSKANVTVKKRKLEAEIDAQNGEDDAEGAEEGNEGDAADDNE